MSDFNESEESFVQTPAEIQENAISSEELEHYKKQLAKFGIFMAILVVCLSVLLVFTLLSRKSWNEGLSSSIEKYYSKAGEKIIIKSQDKIESPFSVSAASYTIQQDNKDIHAVIIRITTLYGPLPAIFTYSEGESEAKFIDFLNLSPKTASAVKNSAKNSIISYWEKSIPGILQKEGINEK